MHGYPTFGFMELKHQTMKASLFLLIAVTSIFLASCTKDYHDTTSQVPPGGTIPPAEHKYTSMNDFFSKNQIPSQAFTVDAATGGTITAAQGSVIYIPSNAFVTQQGNAVTGNVSIEFKEVYKKSDMLLGDKPTILDNGLPLKSGGEFFIRATSNGTAVQLAPGYSISVQQPLNGFPLDMNMTAFTALTDTFRWLPAQNAAMSDSGGYIFSLFTFGAPVDSGSWCNSDNSTFFAAYPQTVLTLHENDDPTAYGTQVFLLFTDLNSMVHVYADSAFNFPYYYAPQGLNCTMVAVGVKDSVLYSSFVPVTIGTNQTVNFSLSQTSDGQFKAAVDLLN